MGAVSPTLGKAGLEYLVTGPYPKSAATKIFFDRLESAQMLSSSGVRREKTELEKLIHKRLLELKTPASKEETCLCWVSVVYRVGLVLWCVGTGRFFSLAV